MCVRVCACTLLCRSPPPQLYDSAAWEWRCYDIATLLLWPLLWPFIALRRVCTRKDPPPSRGALIGLHGSASVADVMRQAHRWCFAAKRFTRISTVGCVSVCVVVCVNAA